MSVRFWFFLSYLITTVLHKYFFQWLDVKLLKYSTVDLTLNRKGFMCGLMIELLLQQKNLYGGITIVIESSTTMEMQKNGDLVTRSNRILTIFTAVIKVIIHT